MKRTRFVAWVKRTRFVAWVKQNDFNDLYDYAPVPLGLWIIEPLRGTKRRQGSTAIEPGGATRIEGSTVLKGGQQGKAGPGQDDQDATKFRMRNA